MNELRFALRSLRRAPAFTAVAVLTLALGIGATTAVFSVVDGVLIRPLPFRDPDRLVMLWHHHARTGDPRHPISYETYLAVRDQAARLESVSALIPFVWNVTLRSEEGAERLSAQFVSASLFPALGVAPALGRSFTPDEDHAGGPAAVVLSHRLWQGYFGGDPGLVGESITLGDSSVQVVGVMPPGFAIMEDVDLWLPLAGNPLTARGRQVYWLAGLGRLAPGATLDEATAEVATVMRRLELEHPESNTDLGTTVEPLHDQIVGDARAGLVALLAAVGFVLLIACANIAGLALARTARRRPELAVRAALGAGRVRMARVIVAESAVLAGLGGAAGTLIAVWAVALIRGAGWLEVPRLDTVALDTRVLVFAVGLTLVTGILFSLVPALRASHAAPHEVLKEAARAVGSRRTARLRAGLVVAELAMAMVLLTGAGLLLRSFAGLMRVEPGFAVDGVVTLQLGLPSGAYESAAERIAFYDRLFEELGSVPGVQAAGGVTRLPLAGEGVGTRLEIEGRPVPVGERPEIEFRRATSGYFDAMRIPVVAGRGFTAADGAGSRAVVVINRTAAHRFWPGTDPVGARIRPFTSDPDATPWYEVVGVVGDVRHFGLDRDVRPEMYIPFAQGQPPGSPLIALRASGTSAGLVTAVRARIRGLDPDIVVWDVATMRERLGDSVAARRFGSRLIAGFALFALALAILGIYGTLSHTVAQRTREIGVRVAFGARTEDIARLVARQGLAMGAAGLALGLLGAAALGRVLEGLLFAVGPLDPLTLGAVALVLLGTVLIAALVPARRAARIDPVEALRHD